MASSRPIVFNCSSLEVFCGGFGVFGSGSGSGGGYGGGSGEERGFVVDECECEECGDEKVEEEVNDVVCDEKKREMEEKNK